MVIVDIASGQLRRYALPAGVLPGPFVAVKPENFPDKFRWSPDGRSVLVPWQKAVVLDVDTGMSRVIADQPSLAEWAPGADGVYYFTKDSRSGALGNFHYRRLDGSPPVTIMNADAVRALGWGESRGLLSGSMTLSPRGSRLVVAAPSTGGTSHRLRIYDVRPGEMVDLARATREVETGDIITALEWAPNETALATMGIAFTKRPGTVKIRRPPPGVLEIRLELTEPAGVAVKVVDLATGVWRTVANVDVPLDDSDTIAMLGSKTLSWSQ